MDQSLNSGTEFSDGIVTNSGSFQKIYTQNEFRQYLEAILGRKPYMASLGIAYVFKDESVESSHLAQLSITPLKRARADLFSQFAADPAGQELVETTRKLGRPPLPSEFDQYPTLLLRFGPRSRIDRLVSGLLNPQSLAEARDAKRNDILTYFAMLQLRGVRPPPIRLLPRETQADTCSGSPDAMTKREPRLRRRFRSIGPRRCLTQRTRARRKSWLACKPASSCTWNSA